jgi:glyoxylase-like metal-dependent hydrolase (beta-lactamase superfamily II)
MTAELTILVEGYADERVASSVTLLRHENVIAIVDPGMVSHRRDILDPLRAEGVRPEDVTDVIFSHHHPDHTLNAALFENAQFHDFMAIYASDLWEDRRAEGYQLTGSIWLLETPGHTPQDITTMVQTSHGLVGCTHLWWSEFGPADDPFATDRSQLRTSRERVLGMEPALVIPGHGAPFIPGTGTPR